MMKLALILSLMLSGADAFAATGAPLLPPRGLSEDGAHRRAALAAGGRSSGSSRAQQRRRRRGNRVPVAKGNRDRARVAVAALPPVTEIDAGGLKTLLQRDDSQQAARPLLVNFWATWCVPCRKEFPDLVKIEADYRGRGLLEFALVSADDVSDIKTAVPKFLREMRATAMPAFLLNAADTQAAIAQVDPAWGGELPATFLFDGQGKLAYKHFGIIDAAKLREEIDKVTGKE